MISLHEGLTLLPLGPLTNLEVQRGLLNFSSLMPLSFAVLSPVGWGEHQASHAQAVIFRYSAAKDPFGIGAITCS